MKKQRTTNHSFAEQPKAATTAQLPAELAAPGEPLGALIPATVAVRKAVDDAPAGGWTPSKMARALADARTLADTRRYFSLAEEIEEKDGNYRSVIATRKLAVASLPFRIEPASEDASDVAVADFVREQLESAEVRGALKNLLDAISKGVSVVEIIWKPSATTWTIDRLEWRDPRFFQFSKTDGKTLSLLPAVQGGQMQPLPEYKFIVHTPSLKAGLPIRSGLAFVAAWAYVLKWLALKDWAALLAVYGKPAKKGTYKPGTRPEDIAVLKRAVREYGSDAGGVFPDTMSIAFDKDGSISASADMFERLVRYQDEQVAKLVLGASLTTGTSNTGSGGSQALGVVHNELRADIMRDDAMDLSTTLSRQLVAPLVALNFGEDVALPRVSLIVEEPEDQSALSTIAKEMAEIGVPLSKKGLAARFGLPLAEAADDSVVVPGQGAQSGAQGAFSAWSSCPEHGVRSFAAAGAPRDRFDDLADEMLADYEPVSQSLDDRIAALAADSTSLDDLRAKLAAFVQVADVTELQRLLGSGRAKGRAAGRFGADV